MELSTKIYGNEENRQVSVNANTSATRAMSEVQGQIIMAKKFPRDIFEAEKRILDSCKRFGFAQTAQYSYPRSGQTVSGPSIRLAEVIAQSWGNLDFGIRELSQENGESLVEAYCWDLETNVKQTKVFSVRHERKAKGKIDKLTDPRDIYELVANMGARRVRSCILGIIPQDIVESAMNVCDQTLAGDTEKPMVDRIRAMVKCFSDYGVDKAMLEERLNHSVEQIDTKELSELGKIYNSIKDGMTKREDWFKFAKEKSESVEDLNATLKSSSTVSQPAITEKEPVDTSIKKGESAKEYSDRLVGKSDNNNVEKKKEKSQAEKPSFTI